MRTFITLLVLIGAAAGGVTYYSKRMAVEAVPNYRLVAVKRGDVASTISATGTVEPEEVVDVGAQVAGLILEFGPDPNSPNKLIDYGSVVEKDTVLARIDPTSYQAALDQAEANLEKSNADLLQLEAKCDQAEQDFKRAQHLRPLKAIADSDYDTYEASFRAAKANVAVGKATIRQNEASLRMAKVNFGYTVIKSPVRGVIIDRRVNIGQTVVASLNAPSLFLIAKDLRRMQVWASVNEADIGQIHVGMPARFTVDAHAGLTFRGKVTQIRMNAQMTQNVVTYTVVVTSENPEGKLLPYLTANLHFELQERSGVLLVPNAVLRWKPAPAQIAATTADEAVKPAQSAGASAGGERGQLWTIAHNGLVQAVDVTVGVTDGTVTEVSGPGVSDGLRVVAGEEGGRGPQEPAEEAGDGDKSTNPFLPKPPKGAKPPPGPPI
jgi:HlyD family secretion protein